MTKSKNIANRLQEVLIDGKWISNNNIKELIDSINWEAANSKIGDHNSIAQLTFHLNYYLGGVLNVFRGGELKIRDKFSFDMEPITSQKDWQALRDSYTKNAHEFIHHVSKMTDQELNAGFVKEAYGTYERNIEGMIEHCYYHLGQISLIKKLTQKPNP